MNIVGVYSFNRGKEVIEQQYATELNEIVAVIREVTSTSTRDRIGAEIHTPEHMSYQAGSLQQAFTREFQARHWQNGELTYAYPGTYYTSGYNPGVEPESASRKIDFIKNRLGVDLHLGQSEPPIYSGCANMTIFHNLGLIDIGVEIVPVKDLVDGMSPGVPYFEQFVWDLEARGVSDIDIPVLILGISL